jgi:hypothetical protein
MLPLQIAITSGSVASETRNKDGRGGPTKQVPGIMYQAKQPLVVFTIG